MRIQSIKLFLFATCISIISFILFAKYGFNFMDEGYILSISNRLVNGQIPHLDFTSLRPIGSSLLHTIEILITKKYTILLSRFFFWIQEGFIAFLWTLILNKRILDNDRKDSSFAQYFLFLIIFIFNINYCPNFAWHTIDGLFFSTIGFYFLINQPKFTIVGFLFIGYAAICKQGYMALIPLAMILYYKRYKFFVFLFLPLVVYILFITYNNAWLDFKMQMSSHGELIKIGVLNYIKRYYFWIGIFIGFLFQFTSIKKYKKYFFMLVLIITTILLLQPILFIKFSFFIFGLSLTFLCTFNHKNRNLYLIAIALVWCASISLGFANPLLGLGILLGIMVVQFLPKKNYISTCYMLIMLVVFYFIKVNIHYLDTAKKETTYSLTNVINGAAGIYTSKNIYSIALEIKELQQSYKNISLQPDYCSARVLQSHQNPIMSDWCNTTEVNNDYLLQKITSNLKKDTSVYFAVAKYQTSSIFKSKTPLNNTNYNNKLINYIKQNYKPVKETNYFIIYH